MKSFNPSVDDLKASSRDERIRKVTPYAFSNKASSYPSFSKKEKYLEGNGRYWTRTPYNPLMKDKYGMSNIMVD